MFRLIPVIFLLLMLTLFSPRDGFPLMAVEQEDRTLEEHNFYFDGQHWKPNWLQCDGAREIAVLTNPADETSQSLVRFAKNRPLEKQTIQLERQDEPDCGMMKCWWNFKTNEIQKRFLAIQESHYRESSDGYWTNRYWMRLSVTQPTSQAELEPCRWFLRTRVAAITDRQSLYVTETAKGGLVLRVFDFRRPGTRPSLTISNGLFARDDANHLERYSFNQRSPQTSITISLRGSDSSIEVLTGSARRARKENVISYSTVR